MKTNDSNNMRSEHARNEERDSQGRFTSKDESKTPRANSKDNNRKEDDSKERPRDSHGHFKSEDEKKRNK